MKMNLRKFNPFNKNKDQKRDQDGKFTAGSGGLSKLKKFNWSRNAPIIAVVTLVGGYFVYQSFAGTALYRYQYSTYQCPGFNKDDTNKNKSESCVNGSAEALVYRYYKAVFGRDPDKSGYQYWTQQLAGDRTKPSRVAQLMLASGEAQYDKMPNADYVAKLYQNILGRNGDPGGMAFWNTRLDNGSWTKDRALAHFAGQAKISVAEAQTKMGKPSNEQFVKGLYVSLMGREADPGGLTYWQGQLDSNKLSRSDMLARFAVDQASMTALGSSFATFVQSAPKNEVVQTAVRIRDERLFTAAVNANNAKKAVDPVAERVSKARQERDGAKAAANKSKPSRGDLTSIANREKTVRAYLSRSQEVPSTTGGLLNKNKDLYEKAADVAKWSPDISADSIKSQYDKTVIYHELAKNGREDLKKLVGDISSSYKVAEGKYEAEEESRNNPTGGTTPAPYNPVTTETCEGGRVVPKGTDCGATVAEINDYMNAYCAAAGTFIQKTRTDGGEWREKMMSYYAGNGLRCSTKSAPNDYRTLFCDPGYSKNSSGRSCSPTRGSFYDLPKAPYNKCTSGLWEKGHLCIRNTRNATRTFSEGRKSYYTAYERCKRYNTPFGVRDTSCIWIKRTVRPR